MNLSQSHRRILEPREAPDFGLYVKGKRQPFLSNKKRPSFLYKVQQKLNNESLKKYFNFVSSTKYDFSLKMDYFSLIYTTQTRFLKVLLRILHFSSNYCQTSKFCYQIKIFLCLLLFSISHWN